MVTTQRDPKQRPAPDLVNVVPAMTGLTVSDRPVATSIVPPVSEIDAVETEFSVTDPSSTAMPPADCAPRTATSTLPAASALAEKTAVDPGSHDRVATPPAGSVDQIALVASHV